MNPSSIRATETAGNGDAGRAAREVNRLLWWLLGGFAAITISLGGGAYSTLSARVSQMERDNLAQSVVLAGQERDNANFTRRLDSIETKLDRALDLLRRP